MLFTKFRPVLKYSLISAAGLGTIFSLQGNEYQVDSIGIVRLSRAAITVFQISEIYKTELYRKDLDRKSEEYCQVKSVCHQKAAEKLLDLCCSNKGVYIKVGQYIAALDYLLPSEYVQTMKVLHCNAPKNKIEDVYKVLREDLKKDPLEVFQSIDPNPIGTASLAQVHKAVLKDGTVVALKVQHPYVQGNSRVDMTTMEYLVKIVSMVFPEFNFQWLVDESKKNIPLELDFMEEGRNAEKVRKLFQNVEWLKIPEIKWDYTTPRVLTMEFVEGGQVNDIKYIKQQEINPFEVSEKLGQLYSEMIFIHGFVHSDPHPGNILVKKSHHGHCDIVLLDHGLYANLKDDFRIEYANFWLSILNRDRKAMRLHSKNLGIEGDHYGLLACMVTGRAWHTILKGIDREKMSKSEKQFMQQNFTNILPQVSEILQNVNRQILLILKTNDLMRGIEHSLETSTRMGAFKVMSQCCVNAVYRKKYKESSYRFDRMKIALVQYWTLFKISVYYTYLNFRSLSYHVLGF